ncbi:bifunctional metallophosphatase/5'-nucleotidase [Candidatus Avelusimicrobium alvi]|uniref:bifunctional metallophosphatase/5'-nucleotidase n=1 Tax=Candidatus Avelusimicrobium alvi TaxID=3416221 RepID=UPI003D0B4D5E
MRVKRFAAVLAGLVLLGGCAREELTSVDIFFTADVQGFYWSRPEPRLDNREAGGYAVLKNFLQSREGEYLLFDGGSWFGSAPEGTMTKGAYVDELARTLPYTAGTISDKDLVYGWPSLRAIVREMPYPFVVANLRLENQIPWPMHDYQIRTVNGIKIGVFGLINPTNINKNKSRLLGLSAQDPVQAAKTMAALLHEKGVDYIILLSSLGDPEKTGVSDTSIAEEVSGIHLILSSNKDRENAETDQINNTFIVYPGSKLDSVALVRLSFDKNKQFRGQTFEDIPLLKDSFSEDAEIAGRAASLRVETRKKMNARVAELPAQINTALAQESALGNLLTQCLYKWSRLDGAVLNSDSIRSSLPAGRLSEYDLYKAYPYGDNITFLTIKGAAFVKAMEASLNAKDNFPQIAGFTVSYADTPQGKKIRQITLDNGRIVRPQDTYRFAVTDHVLAGGFGHDGFIDSLEFKNTFVEARQIMRSCLARQKTVEAPALGRWKKVK